MNQRGVRAELNDIRCLLAAMDEARYSDGEDDDGGECESEMDMDTDVVIYSDTDGKHRELLPLTPRHFASEILGHGTLHLDNLATHVESVSLRRQQTDKRRKVHLSVSLQRRKRRRCTQDPEKMDIPVYVYMPASRST